MPQPHFNQMLKDRREDLGLSINQASQVLRIREQVLRAFEEADFAAMPAITYVQGMISAYARYLGLDERMVLDRFVQDERDYRLGIWQPQLGLGAHSTSTSQFRPTGSTMHNTPLNGDFPRSQGDGTWAGRGGNASFEAGASIFGTPSVTSGRLYRPTYEEDEGMAAIQERHERRLRQENRPYTSPEVRRSLMRSSRRVPPDSEYSRSGFSDDTVVSRPVRPNQYADDLIYSDSADPYHAASSQEGREASRNIAQIQRPRIDRRDSMESRRKLRQRTAKQAERGGFLGFLDAWFSSRQRTIATIFAAVIVLIMVIVTVSIKSCVNDDAGKPKPAVNVSTTQAQDAKAEAKKKEEARQDKLAEEKAKAEAKDKQAAAKENDGNQEVNVSVAVKSGQVAWIEIKLDGKIKVATSKTGPWKATYKVKNDISIQTDKPDSVIVKKNGNLVPIENKVGGIGMLTIDGPVDLGEATQAETDTGAAGKDSSSTSGSSQSQQTGNQ